MKQPEDVRAFKTDLGSYNFKLKKIRELNEKIENIYDRLGGVRGVDPSREPIHSPPNKDLEYAMRDQITACERKLARLRDQTDEVKQILDRMETSIRMAVIAVYADRKTISAVSMDMNLSETGLRKRMNKAIEKALD